MQTAPQTECISVADCPAADERSKVRHQDLGWLVLSESAERVDKREKLFAFTSFASPVGYVLVPQTARHVAGSPRTDYWKAATMAGAKIRRVLESIELPISRRTIDAGV